MKAGFAFATGNYNFYIMNKILVLLAGLLLGLHVLGADSNQLKLYVGTFTSEGAEGIYLCSFNTESGEITLTQTFNGVDDPSFVRLSPNRQFLYVVTQPPKSNNPSGGYVNAYKVKSNGDLQFLNKQVSHGSDPCYVDVSRDGKYVAIANYSSGTTAMYPVQEDGYLEESSSVIQDTGSGPNKGRQNEPHAHSIRFSPFDNTVFSADLGADKLNIYHLENGKLVAEGQEYVKLAPGAGPRHFEFNPDGKTIYVISELNSTVTVVQKEEDEWKVKQQISTLPADFSGRSYCADIHISKDGKFLYGSNRGDNSITVFKIKPDTKQLVFLSTVSVEGNWPRNFTLSPDGKFMLVANERSGNITVFKVNQETGIPEFTGKEIKLPAPVCLEFY